MEYTKLGNSDLQVSRFCVGCMMARLSLILHQIVLRCEKVQYIRIVD